MKRTVLALLLVLLISTGAGATNLNYTAAQIDARLKTVHLLTDYGAACNGTSDDSQALSDALTAITTAGGGTLVIDGLCKINSQIIIPNGGAAGTSSDAGQTLNNQYPIRIVGLGYPDMNGSWAASRSASVSGLDLRYSGSGAKIITRGLGSLEISHLLLVDGGSANNTPFILTTNTTLRVHDNALKGSSATVNSTNDGIILGGTDGTPGNASTSPFQGYGTVIENNFFDQMRQTVVLYAHANGVSVSKNTVSATCGYSTGAPFVIMGSSNGRVYSSVFRDNLIEALQYAYGFYIDYGTRNQFYGNGVWDAGGSYASDYYLTSHGTNNFIVSSESGGTILSGDATAMAGTYVTKIDSTANFKSTTVYPDNYSCGLLNRGQHIVFQGGSGIGDMEMICAKIKYKNDAYAWMPAYGGRLGAEIITSNDFTGFTGTGWTISGTAVHTTGTDTLEKNNVTTKGHAYVLTYTIASATAGTLVVYAGVYGITRDTTGGLNGTFSEFFFSQDTDTHLYFFPSTDFDGTLSAPSLKEFIPYGN